MHGKEYVDSDVIDNLIVTDLDGKNPITLPKTYVRAEIPVSHEQIPTVQITFIFIDFRVCNFAFAFKTQNAPCVSRFKRVLFSDRFQFAF